MGKTHSNKTKNISVSTQHKQHSWVCVGEGLQRENRMERTNLGMRIQSKCVCLFPSAWLSCCITALPNPALRASIPLRQQGWSPCVRVLSEWTEKWKIKDMKEYHSRDMIKNVQNSLRKRTWTICFSVSFLQMRIRATWIFFEFWLFDFLPSFLHRILNLKLEFWEKKVRIPK